MTRLLFLLFLFVANSIYASDGDSTKLKNGRRVIILPAVLRSPETKWGGGAGVSLTFRTNKGRTSSRTSSVQALALYTQRHQKIFGTESVVFFHKENYILRFHGTYTLYPDKFWGVGNNSGRTYERFEYQQFFIFPQLLKRVYKKLYVGISAEYQHVIRFNHQPDGLFTRQDVAGRQGGVISGVGALLTWDDRDNAFSPQHGQFIEFSATSFSDKTKSDFMYTNWVVDVRKYFSISADQVVATQLYGNFNKGTVPFLSLATLGGSMIMRGYYSGRFRDHNIAAAQVEYRLHIWRKWGAVAFAGVGQVANRLDRFAIQQFKCAAGTGIRYALKPADRLNLRLDYGTAAHSQGFYITISEAF